MTTKDPDAPKHPIQVVTLRTGINPNVLRVWERRYRAVVPQRSVTNRRVYSDADVERLRLLRRATSFGRRIGSVASLTTEELREMVKADEAAAAEAGTLRPVHPKRSGSSMYLEDCLVSVERFDAETLKRHLSRAELELSTPRLLDELLLPLMEEVGSRWSAGSLRVAHEHLTTAVARSFLGTLRDSQRPTGKSADITIATPTGQAHELGALAAAVAAALDGWRVTYLGTELPADEIAVAARKRDSRVVALSVIHPADDPDLGKELARLRRLLPEGVVLIVGGSAASAYDSVLERARAERIDDLPSFRSRLELFRTRGE